MNPHTEVQHKNEVKVRFASSINLHCSAENLLLLAQNSVVLLWTLEFPRAIVLKSLTSRIGNYTQRTMNLNNKFFVFFKE